MNYPEVLEYLYASLPMYHRVGKVAMKPGLDNIIELCQLLQNPHRSFKSIHVAGTNGKGSTSHMLASIFQEAGYKTGLYTSPHLVDYRERIKINGIPISTDFVCDFVNKHKSDFEKIKPSFFEMTVAMAFDFFSKEKVEIAIVEVGLGGRLDSTNIINPELSVITNISMDHQDLLGDTLEKIASEKAGIIKESKPVVISETQSSLISVFTKKAQESRSPIFFADSFIRIQRLPFNEGGKLQLKVFQNNEILFENLEPDLVGTYQINNLQGVLASTVILKNLGWQISNEAIKNGIENTIKNTELQGRWQMLQKEPKIIADIAHNEGGIEQLLLQLSFEKYQNLYWIFGMVSDKDVEKILRLIPKECHYIFCQAQIPRALDANLLYEKAKNNGLKGEVIASVKEAYQRAILLATPQDLILVGGSTFVVAEVLT